MKKLFVIMFVVILLLGSVSAFEFDNVKSYDEETKTITVKNAFGLGDDIAKITLNTPLNYRVEPKYTKVAEFYLENYEDYNNPFKELELFNLERSGNKFSRAYDWKYLTYEEDTVNDFGDTCSGTFGNGTANGCKYGIIGSHKELLPKWNELNSESFKKNDNLTIGLFTNVEFQDNVEWIPNFFGVRITEWATWTTDLDVGLYQYWSFDQASGTTVNNNVTGGQAGAITGLGSGIEWVSGILGNAMDFDGTSQTGVSMTGMTSSTFAYTFNFWIKERGSGGSTYVYDIQTGRFGLVDSGGGFVMNGAGGGNSNTGTLANDWSMVTAQYFPETAVSKIYVNATQIGGDGSYSTNKSIGGGIAFGVRFNIAGEPTINAILDEFGIWNRTLTEAEITYLYNNGEACAFGDGACGLTFPTVNLDSPANTTNLTLTNDISFNATIFDDKTITNASLIIDDLFNATNVTAGVNNSLYTFNVSGFGDGNHTWTMEACNFDNLCVNATQRTFNINTTPNIVYGAGVPATESKITNNFFDVNVTITENFFLNLTFDLYNTNAGLNQTVTFTNSSRNHNWTNIPDGDYSYNVTVATNTNQFNNTETRNISIDGTTPALNVFFPNETITFHSNNTNLFVNWSVNDTNPDTCTLQYIGVNNTVTCTDNQTTLLINNSFNRNLTFYANDTFGNVNSQTVTWNYRLYQENEIFTTPVMEGASSVFSINLTTNGSAITIGNLSYNLSGNIGTIVGVGNSYEINRTIIAPIVEGQSNESFFWKITQAGTFDFSTAPQGQTINNIAIDSCTVNTEVLYNFTIVDEITQVKLPTNQNNTGDLNLQVFAFATTELIQNFSNAYTGNTFSVCFNDSMSSGEKFSIDVQVQYSADDYVSEFYHIQNDTLNNADFFTNITLYDLDNTTSQEFSITFKNQNFLAVADALIQVQRRYISEGLFRTVEIPKTDSEGATIVHLELEEVVYTFIVVKFGEVLGTFNDVRVSCNPLLQTCKINLNALASHIEPEDFANLEDFSYTLTFDRGTRTIESVYTIPTNTIGTVFLNATLLDSLGTTQVCSDSVTSSSGTLTCVVPNSFGNASVFVQLSKNDVRQGSGTISLNPDPKEIFDTNIVFLTLFLYLTLIGIGISDSPMVMGIFLLFGVILGIALNLIDATGFIGEGATILWFFIAVFVVLIKGAKRN